MEVGRWLGWQEQVRFLPLQKHGLMARNKEEELPRGA